MLELLCGLVYDRTLDWSPQGCVLKVDALNLNYLLRNPSACAVLYSCI